MQHRDIHGSVSERLCAGGDNVVRDLSDSTVEFSHASAHHLAHEQHIQHRVSVVRIITCARADRWQLVIREIFMSQQRFEDICNRWEKRRQTVATEDAQGSATHHRTKFRLLELAFRVRRSNTVFRYFYSMCICTCNFNA